MSSPRRRGSFGQGDRSNTHMANAATYKDTQITVGDTISVNYRIKDGEKTRTQTFEGILLKIKGSGEEKMITVRKISKVGIGVERIIPLDSPFIDSISVQKKSKYQKAKLYFVRKLSDRQVRFKLYRKS